MAPCHCLRYTMRMGPYDLFMYGLAVVGAATVGWTVYGVGCVVRTWWRGWLTDDGKGRKR